jgi:hypothetical protein
MPAASPRTARPGTRRASWLDPAVVRFRRRGLDPDQGDQRRAILHDLQRSAHVQDQPVIIVDIVVGWEHGDWHVAGEVLDPEQGAQDAWARVAILRLHGEPARHQLAVQVTIVRLVGPADGDHLPVESHEEVNAATGTFEERLVTEQGAELLRSGVASHQHGQGLKADAVTPGQDHGPWGHRWSTHRRAAQ